MEPLTATFIGHRKINKSAELEEKLYITIENLINDGVKTFLFGSRSEFDDLCLVIVTKLKEKCLDIRRIYVRAEFPYIDENSLPNKRNSTQKAKSGTRLAYDYAVKKKKRIINVFSAYN